MLNYNYAYLFGNIFICLPVWLILFVKRKDLRKEMFFMSILGLFLAPLSEFFYFQDYWQPEFIQNSGLSIYNIKIYIEDLLFGFFVAGIASIVYEEFFSKKLFIKNKKNNNNVFLLVPFAILIILLINFFFNLKFNSIYASIFAFLLIALIIFIFRKDLLLNGLLSGLIMGIIMYSGYILLTIFFPEIFIRWWNFSNISGITLNKIPIEEIFWAFSWGLMAGPLWEFITFSKTKNLNQNK